MSTPLSDADLDAIEAAENALRGRTAPPDLAEEAMDIIFATPRLLAEVRRLRALEAEVAEARRWILGPKRPGKTVLDDVKFAVGWQDSADGRGGSSAYARVMNAAEEMRERAATPTLEDPQAMADALAEKSTHLVSWPNDRPGYTMGALTAIRERDRQWAEAIRALPVEPHK